MLFFQCQPFQPSLRASRHHILHPFRSLLRLKGQIRPPLFELGFQGTKTPTNDISLPTVQRKNPLKGGSRRGLDWWDSCQDATSVPSSNRPRREHSAGVWSLSLLYRNKRVEIIEPLSSMHGHERIDRINMWTNTEQRIIKQSSMSALVGFAINEEKSYESNIDLHPKGRFSVVFRSEKPPKNPSKLPGTTQRSQAFRTSSREASSPSLKGKEHLIPRFGTVYIWMGMVQTWVALNIDMGLPPKPLLVLIDKGWWRYFEAPAAFFWSTLGCEQAILIGEVQGTPPWWPQGRPLCGGEGAWLKKSTTKG